MLRISNRREHELEDSWHEPGRPAILWWLEGVDKAKEGLRPGPVRANRFEKPVFGSEPLAEPNRDLRLARSGEARQDDKAFRCQADYERADQILVSSTERQMG